MKKALLRLLRRILKLVIFVPFIIIYSSISALIWLPFWLITGDDFMEIYFHMLPDYIFDKIERIGGNETY